MLGDLLAYKLTNLPEYHYNWEIWEVETRKSSQWPPKLGDLGGKSR